MRDLDGGQTVLLARGTGFEHPKWSPDGSYILFQATSVSGAADTALGGAYLVKRLGGTPQRIGPSGAAAFSSSGDSVVLATESRVNKIQLRYLRSANAEVFDSTSVPLLGLSDLDWSPDGKWLALLLYRGQADRRVILISRRTGAINDSLKVPGHQLVRWVPGGDGLLVLLQGVGSDNLIFRLGVDRLTGRFTGDTATIVEIPRGGSTFGLSRDGTILAYVERSTPTSEFIAMERVGERVTARTVQSFTGQGGAFALSPDGRTIVLSRADAFGENLYVVPFEGGPERPITSDRERHTAPVWLPDGRLVFKKGQPSTQLYVVNPTGGQPQPFGPAGYSTGDPWYLQWLDDSLYVLDQRDHHRVLVVDASGSIRDTLTVPDTLDQLLTVTPDARELWFFDRDLEKGWFYSLDRVTNAVKVAFTTHSLAGRGAPRPNGGVLGWANSNYHVATWPNRTVSAPTVWRVNSDGTFTRIVELPETCDFRFGLSMSRDGRRFVCKRSEARTDIWLLRGVNLTR
jgi:Tol biopolymer transport system component